MYPAAEDNYGYDACALLCLPCSPSILVIATETGILYHCVVLEAEHEEDRGMSDCSEPKNITTEHFTEYSWNTSWGRVAGKEELAAFNVT